MSVFLTVSLSFIGFNENGIKTEKIMIIKDKHCPSPLTVSFVGSFRLQVVDGFFKVRTESKRKVPEMTEAL